MIRLGVRGALGWVDGDPHPEASIVPARLRRRVSKLTRAALGTMGALAERTGLDLARAAVVHGSALGELDVTVELLRALCTDPAHLSPTQFHNSVHNTMAGYLSIATHNRGFSTSVAAGDETTAMALLEAGSLLAAGFTDVAVLLADEVLPSALHAEPSYPTAALALHLTSAPTDRSIRLPTRQSASEGRFDPRLRAHPCRWGFALAARLAAATPGPVALAPKPRAWSTSIEVSS